MGNPIVRAEAGLPAGWRPESPARSVPSSFAGREDPPRRRFAPRRPASQPAGRRTRDFLHSLSAPGRTLVWGPSPHCGNLAGPGKTPTTGGGDRRFPAKGHGAPAQPKSHHRPAERAPRVGKYRGSGPASRTSGSRGASPAACRPPRGRAPGDRTEAGAVGDRRVRQAPIRAAPPPLNPVWRCGRIPRG